MAVEREGYLHSVNLNTDTEFPYLVLDVVNERACPRNPGFRVMHWHEDLQFIYVLEGTIEVRTLDDALRIQAGEGLFINRDVVHAVSRIGSCHYNSFLFPAYFLAFYTGSPVKAMIDAVTENERLPLLSFTPACGWHREILAILRRLAEMEKEKPEFYMYEVLVALSSLWLTMRKHMEALPEEMECAAHARMRKILRYMEEHYAEALTLADLAASANVSKSECARCFRASLNTTPYQYLMEYRLSEAARLLRETDEPVGAIAAAVGFHQASHFGKCFREKTGCSPGEYRKRDRAARSGRQSL